MVDEWELIDWSLTDWSLLAPTSDCGGWSLDNWTLADWSLDCGAPGGWVCLEVNADSVGLLLAAPTVTLTFKDDPC